MQNLRIPGQRESRVAPHELEGKRAGGLLTVKAVDAFRLDPTRAAVGEGVTLKGLADDALMELELEGGLRLWTTAAQLREDLPPQAERGEGELLLPTELPFGTPSRGFGRWVLKALRIFHVELAEEAAVAIAARLEDQLQPGPGLYRCPFADRCELRPLASGEVPFPGDAPVLLFLHGTASSTEGSFGGLWERPQLPVLKALNDYYRGNLFAYQHRTLSQSPVENALELVRLLPKGARLHLVSHSRGGLIGELLCRSALTEGRVPFDDEDLARFAQPERTRDHAALQELGQLLKSKGLRVERFVRVACPARGTTLASKRLDRYLSIILNALGLVPALKASAIYDLTSDFLLAMVKTRTQPEELPGLEGMMPESPLVAVLNRPGVKSEADLSVIAGDLEGSGLWGRLKELATNLFYREDHDLVVNTSAMYGGAARAQGARYLFDQGPTVNHFNYFRNERSTLGLKAVLTGEPADNFLPLAAPPEITRAVYRGPSAQPQPVVILIPGIMGSHLAMDGDRIWLDPLEIAAGGFRKLAIGASGVVAEAPVGMAYLDLIKYLQTSHEVIPFPFDWRRSILQEARRLADAVAAALDRAEAQNQPVRLLAHSMGGLVARVMIAERPELWERLARHPGGRLIMLGTPNSGSYVIPRMLLGREKIVRQLALIDFRHSQKELLKIIAAFPGVLEMLPATAERDFFARETWQELRAVDKEGWVPPDAAALAAARACRELLDKCPTDPRRMLYVAGQAPATPVGLRLDGQEGKGKITILASARGDGRVPWATGIPAGLPVWYLPAEHGNLADHAPAFPALLELLQSGHTGRLPQTPPVTLRGAEERFVLPDEELTIYPDSQELIAAALGALHRQPVKAESHRIRVTARHGNLRYARHPVAVGHYQGDTIISAEDYLDRVLDGRLRARHRLGLYPGPAETAEVFLNPGGKPGGAIVIGLGKAGELSFGKLTACFAKAALMYAAALAECAGLEGSVDPKGRRSATLTTLLIGTGAGGLSVQDSVAAILRGLAQANRVLIESRYGNRVLIDELEFIELYEDLAIQTARAIAQAVTEADLDDQFTIEERISTVPGGRRRPTFSETPGWWRRLQILADADGALRFNSLTDRARAEVSLQATQRALVDRFVEQAITRTGSDRQLSTTLFELLIPNRLKEQTPDRQNLVLVLNEAAARYPWELMQDRDRPLAVDAGIIRQLETDLYRENPNMSTGKIALVVGDPPSDQVELPGAQQEAKAVVETLAAQEFKVIARIGKEADPDSVIKSLFAESYRVVHLAGHGVYDHPVPSTVPGASGGRVSGMVLGPGLFLTPTEVGQMRQVPELVFINCCHLGRIEDGKAPDFTFGHPHKLAANLATQLIRMGVRAVVAAGWAVDDAAAALFAREFYQRMLTGCMFGRAVLDARRRIYEEYPAVNSWGAYQCYGDPDYTLVPREGLIETEVRVDTYHAVVEVISDLENLAGDAYAAAPESIAGLRARVRAIEDRLPAAWLGMAAVRGALGRAYGQLDEFAAAIGHYQAALSADPAEISMKAVEQLANLQIRWGASLAHESDKGGTPSAAEAIREGRRQLELLLALGTTVERLSLMGSACKRLAMLAEGAERDEALAAMVDYYRQAHELAQQKTGAVDPYPLLNWLVGLHLADLRKKTRKARAPLGTWLKEVEQIADERDDREPDFWNGIVRTECLLTRHLAAGDLAAHREAVAEGYLRVFRRGATPKELRSVIEHVDFIIALLDGAAQAETRQALLELRDKLKLSLG